MKTKIVCLGSMAVLFLMTTSLFSQNMDVSGAGTFEVNGIYVVAGTYDGVNYYQKGSILIYRRSSFYW
jgi:hypothetical protein